MQVGKASEAARETVEGDAETPSATLLSDYAFSVGAANPAAATPRTPAFNKDLVMQARPPSPSSVFTKDE